MSKEIVQYENTEKDSKLYYWAPEGDKDNLVYGELYKMKIPNYHHHPSLCLGLNEDEKVIYDRNERVYITCKLGENLSAKLIPRYCHSQYAKELKKITNVKKIISKPTRKLKYKDYLDFNVPKEDLQMYEEKEDLLDSENKIFQKNKEYNERLREEPSNEALWHDYIKFQDEFHATVNNNNGKKEGVASFAVWEKKRSIYLEALQNNADSISLLLGYISSCQQLWDKDKVLALWKSTMSSKPENVELWNHYIDFILSNFSYFTVSEARSVILRAMIAMQSLKLRAERSADFEGVYYIEERIIDFMQRLCVFEYQTGYGERGVAIYQAMVELNCFSPVGLFDFKSKLKSFKEFWNEEKPRIGEGNAKGWAHHHGRSLSPPPPLTSIINNSNNDNDDKNDETLKEGEGEIEDGEGEVEEYMNKEEKRSRREWKPVYSMEHGEGEDVERIVLFDDIKDFLFPILSRKLQEKLIINFIEYLISTEGGKFPAISLHIFNDAIKESSNQAILQPPSFMEHIGPDLFSFLPSHSDSVLSTPLNNNENDNNDNNDNNNNNNDAHLSYSLFSRTKSSSPLLSDPKIEFIRNVLRMTEGRYGERGELYCMAMMFESNFASPLRFAQLPSDQLRKTKLEIKKKCKTILQSSSDLLSWLTFSLIETSLSSSPSSSSDAKRVIDITLSMVTDAKQKSRSEYGELYRVYMELEMESGDTKEENDRSIRRTLHLCVCYINDSFSSLLKCSDDALDISPPSLLRSRRSLEERVKGGTKNFLSAKITLFFDQHLYLMITLMYFEYCSKGIKEGMKVLEEALLLPWPSDFFPEQLFLSGVRMIKSHMKYHTMAPHVMRDILTRAMKLYPSNPFFLSIFVKHEAKSHLENRLRRFFDDVCKDQTSPIIWLFTIKSETSRLGSSHRIVSLFEKAIEVKEVAKCPAIWRNYIEFHRMKGEYEAAKRVYYRAIRAVPFSKLLWLDCAHLHFSSVELKQILNLMIEKDIRLRIDPSSLSSLSDDMSLS